MLNVPLCVRITSADGDKHITRRLHDLSFRSTVPGGFASAAIAFDQPLSVTDPAVAVYGKLYVYDGRSGATVWEGRQEDPGRSSSTSGEVWELNAFGPAVHADDDRLTVCYVENGVESFRLVATGIQSASVGPDDNDPPDLKVALSGGTIWGAGASAHGRSRLLADVGQKLARAKFAWDSGVTDASRSIDIRTRVFPSGGLTTVNTATLNTAGGTLTAVITTDIPSGDDTVYFQMTNNAGAFTVADENHWISAQVVLQGTRYTAAGSEQTSGATYSTDTVLASDVVKDLLGRVLNQFDGANATVATTSFGIDRLVYPDPTSPRQILDDLMALESGYYWAAWESTSTGKARFEWVAWPNTVRYEASIRGDFSSPGNVGDLYNKVVVRYRDRNGRTRSVTRTLAQTDLDAAGITRAAQIDLGDNIGSAANAAQVGDRFLLDHNSPPNQGTLSVTEPIVDLVNGRMVQPWEILPGQLIRVRGVLPRVDALNATDRDAVTVFRIVAVNYTASSNTATLELDTLGRGAEQQIADAHKRIDRLRKR